MREKNASIIFFSHVHQHSPKMGFTPGLDLVNWAQPYCTAYGVPHLAKALPTVIHSLALWLSLQFLSARLSPKLFPKTFANLKKSTRVSWHVHWVAFCHAAIITPLAGRLWWKVYQEGGMSGTHTLARNRVYGYDDEAASIYGIALGYFIWDAVVSALYDGPAFVAHGLVAMTAFIFVFHPIFMYDGLGFLLWEASTPFLNIHWFLDKLGMTGGKLQLLNAFFLLSTYVLARLTFGVYNSFSWMMLVHFPAKAHSPAIPLHIKTFFTVGNITLNSLNFIWFRAMIRAVQKRFTAKDDKGRPIDARKLARGQQQVGKVGVSGTGDDEFEREAGVGNHDYTSHGSYSDREDREEREARWRKASKKDN